MLAVREAVVVLVSDTDITGGFEVGQLSASVWWLRDARIRLVEFHLTREGALRSAAAPDA